MAVTLNLAEARKAVVALAGLAGQALAAGLVHGTAAKDLALGLAFATFAGIYAVPNTTPVTAPVPPVTPPTAPQPPPAG